MNTYCEAHGANLVQNDRCMLCENGLEPVPVTALEDALAAQQEARDAMHAAKSELERRQVVIDQYRAKDAAHERLISAVLNRMNLEDFDGARDLVRAEYDAIHGPAD